SPPPSPDTTTNVILHATTTTVLVPNLCSSAIFLGAPSSFQQNGSGAIGVVLIQTVTTMW
ncbi:hypothetical protein A2U01_0058182, partial [Trifolium medium]|nr:hypothetical protein [Trifolium medium]